MQNYDFSSFHPINNDTNTNKKRSLHVFFTEWTIFLSEKPFLLEWKAVSLGARGRFSGSERPFCSEHVFDSQGGNVLFPAWKYRGIGECHFDDITMLGAIYPWKTKIIVAVLSSIDAVLSSIDAVLMSIDAVLTLLGTFIPFTRHLTTF